jgi:hypothetical protein
MKKLIITVFLVLSAALLFSQESLSQDKAFINRNFRVQIKTRIPYSRDLNVDLTASDPDLFTADNPYLRPYNALTDREGEIIYEDMTEIVLTFRSARSGIYTCSGVRLFRQQFELIIPDFPVIVHSRDEINLDYPLQVYWTPVKEEVYTGEIISLILNVRYMVNLDFPESIGIGKPAGGNLEQVELPGRIDTYDMGDHQVYSYPLESWYFFSGEPGSVTIPGGSARIQDLNRDIPDIHIRIKPLPEEINKSGAVGDFSLVTYLSSDSASEGEILTLTVHIEGTGNFSFLSFPAVESTGLELINTADMEELTPTESGYSGFRERVYRFQAGSESEGSISRSSFSWINPESGMISTSDEESFPVTISLKGTGDGARLSLLTSGELEWLIIKEQITGPLKGVLILPGFLFFILSLFTLNKNNSAKTFSLFLILLPLFLSLTSGAERRAAADIALAQYESGDFEGSYRQYDSLYAKNQKAAYLPNLAVIEYYRGNLVESEILFRKALRTLPGDPALLHKLGKMESLAGLTDQYLGGERVGGELLFLLFALAGNLFFISLAVYLKRRRLRYLFLMASLFFVALGLGSGYGFTSWLSSRPQGIVRDLDEETGILSRIPEETAEEWLVLPPGTALRLVREKKGYYFIRTGYGLEGWIRTDKIQIVPQRGEG